MIGYESATRVQVGSCVRLEDQDGEEEFFVVPTHEADPVQRRISMESPLGRALLGRSVGERVAVRAPGGLRAVTIVALTD
jgi:transcription elongation factor GreA